MSEKSDRIESILRALKTRKEFRVSRRQFASDLIEKFGGTSNLAQIVYDEYHAAQAGSVQRLNLARSIVSWIMDAELDEDAAPAAELSDDQLRTLIGHLMEQVQKHNAQGQQEKVD